MRASPSLPVRARLWSSVLFETPLSPELLSPGAERCQEGTPTPAVPKSLCPQGRINTGMELSQHGAHSAGQGCIFQGTDLQGALAGSLVWRVSVVPGDGESPICFRTCGNPGAAPEGSALL